MYVFITPITYRIIIISLFFADIIHLIASNCSIAVVVLRHKLITNKPKSFNSDTFLTVTMTQCPYNCSNASTWAHKHYINI